MRVRSTSQSNPTRTKRTVKRSAKTGTVSVEKARAAAKKVSKKSK